MVTNALGIYEKALPRGLSWEQTFDLVHELGYNFLEFSVDESDERLAVSTGPSTTGHGSATPCGAPTAASTP